MIQPKLRRFLSFLPRVAGAVLLLAVVSSSSFASYVIWTKGLRFNVEIGTVQDDTVDCEAYLLIPAPLP